MKRTSRIVLAAALLGCTALGAMAQEGEKAPEAAPGAAPASGGAAQPAPGTAVTPDQLPGIRVQKEIQEELSYRQIPERDAYRRSQRLSAHMDQHMGSDAERYHHLDDPEHTHYYSKTAAARADYDGELSKARELSEKEISMEDAAGKQVRYVEDGSPTLHHAYLKSTDADKHVHRHYHIYANEWERTHKGCIWHVRGDIEKVGSRDVPADEGHAVPPAGRADGRRAVPAAARGRLARAHLSGDEQDRRQDRLAARRPRRPSRVPEGRSRQPPGRRLTI